MEATKITGRCWIQSITPPIVIMHFGTDPVTTVTLDYAALTATVCTPRIYWSDVDTCETRPLLVEDLDPAKWMRRTRITNTKNRERFYDAQERLETFLKTVKYI